MIAITAKMSAMHQMTKMTTTMAAVEALTPAKLTAMRGSSSDDNIDGDNTNTDDNTDDNGDDSEYTGGSSGASLDSVSDSNARVVEDRTA